jgi:hypothetical protein
LARFSACRRRRYNPSRPTVPTSADDDCLAGRGGHAIQFAGPIQILDGPGTADTRDHPSQDCPEIAVQQVALDWFARVDDGTDFDPRWKRLTAAADEDERIRKPRRRPNETRLAQSLAVQIEGACEECPKLWIVPDAILSEGERKSLT